MRLSEILKEATYTLILGLLGCIGVLLLLPYFSNKLLSSLLDFLYKNPHMFLFLGLTFLFLFFVFALLLYATQPSTFYEFQSAHFLKKGEKNTTLLKTSLSLELIAKKLSHALVSQTDALSSLKVEEQENQLVITLSISHWEWERQEEWEQLEVSIASFLEKELNYTKDFLLNIQLSS